MTDQPADMEKKRCRWPGDDPLMIRYHDEEWGTPLHDDRKLFEFLVLDAFQAGLSWRTILHKRAAFRAAFDQFDPQKIATYGEEKIADLMATPEIIRNRLKILATVTNAQCFLRVQQRYGSFDRYIWQFTGAAPLQHRVATPESIPATSPESEAMSRALKKLGFKFVGPTICYAFMQASGMINDHLTTCFRYRELTTKSTAAPGKDS